MCATGRRTCKLVDLRRNVMVYVTNALSLYIEIYKYLLCMYVYVCVSVIVLRKVWKPPEIM